MFVFSTVQVFKEFQSGADIIITKTAGDGDTSFLISSPTYVSHPILRSLTIAKSFFFI